MFNHVRRLPLAGFTAFALLFNFQLLSLDTRATPLQQKEEKKDKKKEETAGKDDKSKTSKQEREYQKIKQFSIDRYQKNAEFKEEVDEAYRQKQREHSEYAYDINTFDQADEQVLRNGDKVKIPDTLYDNPLAQDYVNRVGQSIVPASSSRLYAFKITLNPIPEARSLSTGTVYISSGLLSQIDNEAQLAYILGHEVAHGEREHWREDVLVEHGLQEWNEKQQQKRSMISGIASVGLGVMSGGLLRSSYQTGAIASLYAQLAVPTLSKLVAPNAVVTWDKAQEDEADKLGLDYMLARNYDPREVPKFYASLQRATQKDRRAGLGFMASAARITERVEQINSLFNPLGFGGGSVRSQLLVGAVTLNTQRQVDNAVAAAVPSQAAEKPADTGKTLDPTRDAAGRAAAAERMIGGQMSADIKAKLDAGEIIGSTAEFLTVMSELKRDNGVRAFYYDMFQMARDNLSESLQIRSNDPYAHFYYGKVLKLTARTAAEKSRALAEFRTAIDLDARRVLPEARLHRALAMIENKDPAQLRDIVASLKEYVMLYQREHGGSLPPNMEIIYDYMQEAGEMAWSAPPALNVSTKNIDPIGISTSTAPRPLAAVSSDPPASLAGAPAATQPAAKPSRGTRKP